MSVDSLALPGDLSSDPHAGRIVPVVTVALFDEGSRVLLLKRRKPPYSGFWELVGGQLEFGETLEHAALRELEEETGVSAAQVEESVFASHFEFLLPNYHRLLFTFGVKARSPRVVVSEHEEFDWFLLDALPSPLIPFVREEIEAAARALSLT